MDLNLKSSEEYNLGKLAVYLNYELSSSVLLVMWYLSSITLPFIVLAPAIFIPYMLYVFYKEQKVAWFFSFCCIVVIPAVCLAIISSGSDYFMAAWLIPLGLFYIYCGILRYLVNSRMNEIQARKYFKNGYMDRKHMLRNAKDRLS